VIFALLLAIGIGAGAGVGTQLEYHLNPRSRVPGFPVPLVVFVLEGENWTDFVPPTPVQYGAVAANILAAVATALIPLTIAARIVERRKRRASCTNGVRARLKNGREGKIKPSDGA
jgi:hypothetical protein